MDFAEDPDHRLIREAVREVCARFPDEYWAGLDESHTFPWEFFAAMAKGGWARSWFTGSAGAAWPAEGAPAPLSDDGGFRAVRGCAL